MVIQDSTANTIRALRNLSIIYFTMNQLLLWAAVMNQDSLPPKQAIEPWMDNNNNNLKIATNSSWLRDVLRGFPGFSYLVAAQSVDSGAGKIYPLGPFGGLYHNLLNIKENDARVVKVNEEPHEAGKTSVKPENVETVFKGYPKQGIPMKQFLAVNPDLQFSAQYRQVSVHMLTKLCDDLLTLNQTLTKMNRKLAEGVSRGFRSIRGLHSRVVQLYFLGARGPQTQTIGERMRAEAKPNDKARALFRHYHVVPVKRDTASENP